jgi:hypothetical protein
MEHVNKTFNDQVQNCGTRTFFAILLGLATWSQSQPRVTSDGKTTPRAQASELRASVSNQGSKRQRAACSSTKRGHTKTSATFTVNVQEFQFQEKMWMGRRSNFGSSHWVESLTHQSTFWNTAKDKALNSNGYGSAGWCSSPRKHIIWSNSSWSVPNGCATRLGPLRHRLSQLFYWKQLGQRHHTNLQGAVDTLDPRGSVNHHQLGLYRWAFRISSSHTFLIISPCSWLQYFISVLISTLQFGTFRSSVRKGILSTAGHTLSRRLLNRPACRVWTLGCQRWYDLSGEL